MGVSNGTTALGIAVAQALAASVMKLAAMPEAERIHFGSNGQKYFREHFDPKMLTSYLITMLSDLVGVSEELET